MTIRTVDSWMQLVDRLIVCRLKEYHYSKDSRHTEASYAKEQAEELADVATQYMEECLSGDREPRVHRHLRYHNHDAGEVEASSVMEAVSQLSSCHAEYWEAQGKALVARNDSYDGAVYVADNWQRVCDSCNQRRNELIQKGDDLLRRMWEQRKPERIVGHGLLDDWQPPYSVFKTP